jgi:chromosome partitioning protein
MSIIMLINLKGGVAKTTSAVAIAECLASQGHRTLMIDADHQCMAGELLLGDAGQAEAERKKHTLHDLLADMLDADFKVGSFPGYVRKRASDIGGGLEKLSVLPCSIRMDDFVSNMAKARRGYNTTDEFIRSLASRKKQMRKWLKANYNFTIIDCPPSLAMQVKILLAVADRYIVPCIPDRLSVRGSLFLLDRVRKRGFKIAGVGTLWSLYRVQNPLHCKIIEQAKRGSAPFDQLPKPFETVIPNAAKIAEATEPGQRPKTFRQKYSPQFAKLFEALCGEIVRRVEREPAAVRDEVLVN